MDNISLLIEDQARQFEAAIIRSDIEAIARMYAQDAVLLEHDHPEHSGREAIAAFWRGAMQNGLRRLSIEPTRIEAVGDVAIETGEFTAFIATASGDRSNPGRFMLIWRRRDGNWYIYRHMSNSGPAD